MFLQRGPQLRASGAPGVFDVEELQHLLGQTHLGKRTHIPGGIWAIWRVRDVLLGPQTLLQRDLGGHGKLCGKDVSLVTTGGLRWSGASHSPQTDVVSITRWWTMLGTPDS